MNTFLGVSPELAVARSTPTRSRPPASSISKATCSTGPRPRPRSAPPPRYAQKAGRKVALTLSDAFCVDRHRAEFLAFIRDHVDILFANESEITALYQTKSFEDAARHAAIDAKVAVLTRSAKGAVIHRNGTSVAVPADKVEKVVDTTGAGDLYAAGFLFGRARGLDNDHLWTARRARRRRDHQPRRRPPAVVTGGLGADNAA